MRFNAKFASITLLLLVNISCQQNVKETVRVQPGRDSVPIVPDNTPPKDSMIDSGLTADSSNLKTKAPQQETPKFTIREGKHNLSLQWISWEELGVADVKHLGDNKYRISGEQRHPQNDDYLKIDGTLEVVSKTELIFNGTVETKSESVNNGKPCLKEGKQRFLSTKNRRYWRMQDMENCEGGMVLDYVDIYF